jgi:hypothetical protein
MLIIHIFPPHTLICTHVPFIPPFYYTLLSNCVITQFFYLLILLDKISVDVPPLFLIHLYMCNGYFCRTMHQEHCLDERNSNYSTQSHHYFHSIACNTIDTFLFHNCIGCHFIITMQYKAFHSFCFALKQLLSIVSTAYHFNKKLWQWFAAIE